MTSSVGMMILPNNGTIKFHNKIPWFQSPPSRFNITHKKHHEKFRVSLNPKQSKQLLRGLGSIQSDCRVGAGCLTCWSCWSWLIYIFYIHVTSIDFDHDHDFIYIYSTRIFFTSTHCAIHSPTPTSLSRRTRESLVSFHR